MLLRTLRNVNAMPPPTIISFTLSNMLSISWILSATFALNRTVRCFGSMTVISDAMKFRTFEGAEVKRFESFRTNVSRFLKQTSLVADVYLRPPRRQSEGLMFCFCAFSNFYRTTVAQHTQRRSGKNISEVWF